jgi:hypothetical protein
MKALVSDVLKQPRRVGSKTKLFHAIASTAASVHDAQVPGERLYSDETGVNGDQAYRGRNAVSRERAPEVKGPATSAIVTVASSDRTGVI